MASVIITADFHFGVQDRLQDLLWAAKVVREYANSANIDTVLVLGDLFHDRTSLNIEVLSRVCHFFEETKTNYNQTWIAFPGNHDMFLRHSWEINSLSPLRRHLTVIEEVKLLTLDDRRFWILPFITYEKSYLRVANSIAKKHEDNDILLTHIGVCGAVLNTCFTLRDWSKVSFEFAPWARVYTGHFHSKQQIGSHVWYPGSPIPFKFDEGDVPHGFYVYDLEADSHKFINIWRAGQKFFPNAVPPPQFCTILDSTINQLVEDDVRDNIIRIAVQDENITRDQRQEMREHVLKLGAKLVRWMERKQSRRTNTPHPSLTYREDLFERWVANDEKGLSGIDTMILKQCHEEVVRDAEERYVVEESEF